MTKGIAYYLRWLAVLPGAALAGALAPLPLHLVLYQTLSNFVQPYPETPERLLTPFVVALASVYSGGRIAPAARYRTAIVLFVVCAFLAGGFVFLALFDGRWMGDRVALHWFGLGPVFALAGGGLALYILRDREAAYPN